MVHEHSHAEDLGEKSDLRAGVTLGDLDRRLLFQRIPLFRTRWLALPLPAARSSVPRGRQPSSHWQGRPGFLSRR
jgi:hypothetical protein